MYLPTLQIVNPKAPDSFLIVNEADFDPAKHVRWSARRATAPAGQAGDDLATWIAELLKHPALEVIEKVQAAPRDKVEALKAMREAEAAGKARRTVLDAIDAHVATLTT